MNDSKQFLFGFDWRVGRPWGVAHPDDICYADGKSISFDSHQMTLGIDYNPKTFEVQTTLEPEPHSKLYSWSVGYVSSIQPIKYGYLRVDFIMPRGNNLWPAIWLSCVDTWPPEIDIMEAWSGQYNWSIFKPKIADKVYLINPFANKIFPSCHLGANIQEHWQKSYKKMNGSCKKYLNITGKNSCELIWTPELLRIYYNGHKIMEETDPKVLKYYNDCNGMNIHLNNYITNDFTMDDYKFMEQNQDKKYTKNFIITNLCYSQDYNQYLI